MTSAQSSPETPPGLVSADSHVVEPFDLFVRGFPARWQARAPHVAPVDGGHRWVFPGSAHTAELGLMVSAGRPGEAVSARMPAAQMPPEVSSVVGRLDAQDRDGVIAEVLFPTVGLVALWHPDLTIREACAQVYSEWILDFTSASDRLGAVGLSAAGSPDRCANEISQLAAAGCRAVLLPTRPGCETGYHESEWDDVWGHAAESGIPIAFHVHTVPTERPTGSELAVYVTGHRSCQDVLATLALGGVFERHPALRVVIAEADAGWVPHFMQRLDRAWSTHRHALGGSRLLDAPSTSTRRCVRHTFQDDAFALASSDWFDPQQLLWASDYPHADSTWPRSVEVLEQIAGALPPDQFRQITSTNAAHLFGFDRRSL